jgi:hypothetical protein
MSATASLRTDVDLVRAELELRQLRAQAALATGQTADALSDRIWLIADKISLTPPGTLIGAAVKLRLLADEDIGLLAGDSEADRVSLRQVRDFIEREIAAGHAVVTAATGDGPDDDGGTAA